jgi:TalC/MipB family fructose-6-phosphate aldolase
LPLLLAIPITKDKQGAGPFTNSRREGMKFFIDTANIKEIKAANDLGVLDGVTTNPTLISRENTEPVKLWKEICSIVKGPVNAEVVSLDTAGMVREARGLAKIAKNIVIKIPMTASRPSKNFPPRA